MLLQQRMFEYIGMGPPIGIACWAAIGHDQCRRIANFRPREELQHIGVKHIERYVMFDGCVAIGDQRHVHAKQRTALSDRTHAFFDGRSDDLLPLFAAGLVVVFDAMRSLRF